MNQLRQCLLVLIALAPLVAAQRQPRALAVTGIVLGAIITFGIVLAAMYMLRWVSAVLHEREGDFVGTTMFQGRGAGQGPTASAVVAEELGRVDGSVRGFLAVHVGLVTQTVAQFGTDAQRQLHQACIDCGDLARMCGQLRSQRRLARQQVVEGRDDRRPEQRQLQHSRVRA